MPRVAAEVRTRAVAEPRAANLEKDLNPVHCFPLSFRSAARAVARFPFRLLLRCPLSAAIHFLFRVPLPAYRVALRSPRHCFLLAVFWPFSALRAPVSLLCALPAIRFAFRSLCLARSVACSSRCVPFYASRFPPRFPHSAQPSACRYLRPAVAARCG